MQMPWYHLDLGCRLGISSLAGFRGMLVQRCRKGGQRQGVPASAPRSLASPPDAWAGTWSTAGSKPRGQGRGRRTWGAQAREQGRGCTGQGASWHAGRHPAFRPWGVPDAAHIP